jgi:hypothetical protein
MLDEIEVALHALSPFGARQLIFTTPAIRPGPLSHKGPWRNPSMVTVKGEVAVARPVAIAHRGQRTQPPLVTLGPALLCNVCNACGRALNSPC